MTKKRILATAVVMICLSILASATLAYYTDSATVRNVITSGGVEIEVVEQRLVGDQLQSYPNQPIQIMPATEVSKIVSVRNVQQTAWIRANYTIKVFDSADTEMEVSDEELETFILIETDGINWTEKDGWWYYNEAIHTGDMTEPLFESVVFSGPYMTNEYQGCTIVINVVAEAVQKANNGETVMEAAGWPGDSKA